MSDLHAQMSAAGARLEAADRERDAAMTEVTRLAREAVDQGVPIAELARLLHISRPTAYKLLRGNAAHPVS